MRLKDWAEQQGVHYQTAWRWARAGKMPVPTIKTETGQYLVQVDVPTEPETGKAAYITLAFLLTTRKLILNAKLAGLRWALWSRKSRSKALSLRWALV